jgi:peptidoglycan/xylan/chitin deacetylase (PgdA/CDA1 family)
MKPGREALSRKRNATIPTWWSRREFIVGAAAGLAAIPWPAARAAEPAKTSPGQALIAITLDLEMCRNFPKWEDVHWDYEKGRLDAMTTRYAVEAARRVRKRGGVVHFFTVGQVFEQENVDWLREIIAEGHPVGNHTYDHVKLLATRPADIAARFRRAPWLMRDQPVAAVIEENIRMTNTAFHARLATAPRGFRTPGGFPDGLAGRADVQAMLQNLGFTWVSTKYPGRSMGVSHPFRPGTTQRVAAAQQEAQPAVYPGGLIEIPMSPVSDINAFRNQHHPWKLDEYLATTRAGVEWAIAHGKVYDFLGHPSCLGVVDPEFRVIDLICDLVDASPGRAAIVDLDTIARRVV